MATFSRRAFLHLGAGAMACLALDWPRLGRDAPGTLGRVASPQLDVFERPTPWSRRLSWLPMDAVVQIGKNSVDADGIVWSDIGVGYVRTSEIQPVKRIENAVSPVIARGGQVGEITVPFSSVFTGPATTSAIAYRLYYSATCWVHELINTSGGGIFYRIYDERLGIYYFVKAVDVRLIPATDLTPLSPGVSDKSLVVNLRSQILTAFEGASEVLRTAISAGRLYQPEVGNQARSWTPTGLFQIDRKKPVRHMGAGDAAGGRDELPGVPWVSYFHWKGFSFHGTWWHNDFGRPRSSGCINMRPEEAKWLYRWTMPFATLNAETSIGPGTRVEIVEE